MKIRSQIGYGLFLSSILMVVLMFAMYVLLAITQIWWPALVLTGLVLIMCFVYFNTFYELLPDGIMLACGFVAKAIPYKNIVSMTDEDSSKPSFCLSNKRVLIRYMEDDVLKFTYASPANREQFRELVNKEIARSAANAKADSKLSTTKTSDKSAPRNQERVIKSSELDSSRKNKSREDDLIIVNNIEATTFDKSGKQKSKENKQKAAEEKKLLAKLKKEKQKENKLAAKQNREVRLKQEKALMAQSKKIEENRLAEKKQRNADRKVESLESKLDRKQARFAAKETAKYEKIQSKKQAKAEAETKAKEAKVQTEKKDTVAKEKKEREAAAKQVEKLKKNDEKATARKLKQDKNSKKDDLA